MSQFFPLPQGNDLKPTRIIGLNSITLEINTELPLSSTSPKKNKINNVLFLFQNLQEEKTLFLARILKDL